MVISQAKNDKEELIDQDNEQSIANSSVQERPTAVNYKLQIKIIVIFCLSIALTSLTCGGLISAQFLHGFIPLFQINLTRFLVQFTFCFSFAALAKQPCMITTWKDVVITSGIFVALNGFFYGYFTAAELLPLGTVSGIAVCVMIITNALILLITRKHLWFIYIASVIAIIGILLLTQPTFMFVVDKSALPKSRWSFPCISPYNNHSMLPMAERPFTKTTNYGYLTAVISGVSLGALYNLYPRINIYPLLIWTSLLGILFSFIIMIATEIPVLHMSPKCVLLVLVNVICSQQITLVVPYLVHKVEASITALVNALNLPILFILQITILANFLPGHENWMEGVGAVLCFSATIIGPVLQIYWTRKRQNGHEVLK